MRETATRGARNDLDVPLESPVSRRIRPRGLTLAVSGVDEATSPTTHRSLRHIECPADPSRLARVHGDHVEAAWREAREAQEVVSRGGGDSAALGDGNAVQSVAVGRRAAAAHLDEHEAGTIPGDEVDLAPAR